MGLAVSRDGLLGELSRIADEGKRNQSRHEGDEAPWKRNDGRRLREFTDAALPALKESDPEMLEGLASLVGSGPLQRFFNLDDVIRRIVATVDNSAAVSA